MALNMNEDTKVVDNTQTTTTETTEDTSTVTQEDVEAQIATLEAEKNKAIEEAANYKLAYLKQKSKERETEDFEDETEEQRIRRITLETISETKVAQIDAEKETLLKRLAKENKELKLAQLNKTNTPPSSVGTHSEGTPVKDTTVTADQMAAFKAKGWSDKDIERYKKNLIRYAGR